MPRFVFIVLIVLLVPPTPATAQVGHAPEKSPYRSIRYGSYALVTGGQLFGDGGRIGVGPHDGTVFGLRFTFLGDRPLQVGLGFFTGQMERLVHDPTQPPETRTSGPVGQRVNWVDGHLQFNLTGGKAWRGVAPFVGTATGFAFGENLSEDSAGFQFGTRFYLAPLVGVRFFLGSRLHLQAESRFLFWQLKYPDKYAIPNEWVLSPWLQFGLGYAFPWPF